MKRSIDVCLSPDMMHLYEVQDQTVVVVDILRATSCMTTALAHNIHSITPFAHLPECLALKADGYITAGERDGKKVDGFDMGNSPFEYMDPLLKGKKIAFTTTNGTQAIAKSVGARDIIIASFLNLSAVVNYLRTVPNNILIVCSGWKGKVNLEDTVFAGALVENLKNDFDHACDAPVIAQRLYIEARDDLKEFLKDSSHIKRLQRLNIQKDIEFCLTEDQYHVVPVMRGNRFIVIKP
ncbi:MAG: 2-phosphosulfolactate phosphatase [Cyclobacteriaceae bacterium]